MTGAEQTDYKSMLGGIKTLAKTFGGDLDKALEHAGDYGIAEYLACSQCYELYRYCWITDDGRCSSKFLKRL